jgi:hypothetical protein
MWGDAHFGARLRCGVSISDATHAQSFRDKYRVLLVDGDKGFFEHLLHDLAHSPFERLNLDSRTVVLNEDDCFV